jgi:hypothetical protein
VSKNSLILSALICSLLFVARIMSTSFPSSSIRNSLGNKLPAPCFETMMKGDIESENVKYKCVDGCNLGQHTLAAKKASFLTIELVRRRLHILGALFMLLYAYAMSVSLLLSSSCGILLLPVTTLRRRVAWTYIGR